MLMVGMEGSAVLAVRKVVVVAREAEREVAEGAEAGQQDSCNSTEFRSQRCELAVNNLGWKPTRRSPKRAEDVVLDVRTTLSRSTT